MRPRLIALITFCILLSSLPALALEPGQRVLGLGCWGEDVFWCQRKLMDLGLMSQATGRFGRETEAAVKKLQEIHGLPVDGLVGPLTYQVLNSIQSVQYYTVQKGDSLYTIAKKFGTTMDELVNLNGLTDTTLQIGQRLMVPASIQPMVYVVKPGDSLYTIARRFDVTVDAIVKLNSIKNPTLIRPGQELMIPGPSNS
ncbi:MAG: LysM peptidoglycan-binding domain-containing protein [Firmicutes bacterium]|jgi:LysM repeat protein|nr:LysM peptidoglycan-binding domain-containing protein [Bacillota bacterium]